MSVTRFLGVSPKTKLKDQGELQQHVEGGIGQMTAKSRKRDRLGAPLPCDHSSTCRYHGSALHMELRSILALIIIVQDMVEREVQGVAVDWIFSFRIKFVGSESISGTCRWWVAPGCS